MSDYNLQEALIYSLYEVMKITHRNMHRSMPDGKKKMVSYAQERVLRFLAKVDGTDQRELGTILNIRAGSLSELLGKMERSGLIERSTSEQDRRTMNVRLTDKGRDTVTELEKELNANELNFFNALSEDEQHELKSLLDKIINANQEKNEEHTDERYRSRYVRGMKGYPWPYRGPRREKRGRPTFCDEE